MGLWNRRGMLKNRACPLPLPLRCVHTRACTHTLSHIYVYALQPCSCAARAGQTSSRDDAVDAVDAVPTGKPSRKLLAAGLTLSRSLSLFHSRAISLSTRTPTHTFASTCMHARTLAKIADSPSAVVHGLSRRIAHRISSVPALRKY